LKESGRKYFKSVKSLPIFNFYQILNTKELSWLVKGFNIDDDPIEFEEDEKDMLAQLWFDITSAYNELLGDKVNSNNYIIIAQISEMLQELEIVGSLLSLYSIRPSERLKMEIGKWKYNVEDPEACKKKLNQLKFRIEFTKNKNKELFKTEEEEEEAPKYNLYKDVVLFENSLNIAIDVHKTVLEKWVMITLMHDEMQKEKRKRLNKSKK